MKMTDVDARLAELEARQIDPGLSRTEQNELRDCEITLGMVMTTPRARAEAASRVERFAAERAAKKTPAQLQREIAEVLARPVNTVERGIPQVVDGPPAAGWTKFHQRVHGYPISFYKTTHGQYEMFRRPSDFLVKYAAAVGNISKIKPIEKIGVYQTIDEALTVVADHDRRQ